MENSEAYTVLTGLLAPLLHYVECVRHVESDPFKSFEITGASGTRYLGEVKIFWADNRKCNIKVVGSIQYADERSSLTLSQTILISRPEDERR